MGLTKPKIVMEEAVDTMVSGVVSLDVQSPRSVTIPEIIGKDNVIFYEETLSLISKQSKCFICLSGVLCHTYYCDDDRYLARSETGTFDKETGTITVPYAFYGAVASGNTAKIHRYIAW